MTRAGPGDDGEPSGSIVFRVQPGARRSGWVGWFDGIPKIAVTARAVDGAANDAAIAVVADLFEVRRRSVTLVAGHTARTKRFSIAGVSDREIERRLAEIGGEKP